MTSQEFVPCAPGWRNSRLRVSENGAIDWYPSTGRPPQRLRGADLGKLVVMLSEQQHPEVTESPAKETE